MANVYSKLQEARVLLQNKKLAKSGHNKFSNYDYFQLNDFIPALNEIFKELGLTSLFSIYEKVNEASGVITQLAELVVVDVNDPTQKITFTSPTADATIKGAIPIQALGGVHTYMKRYLYLNALEIVEPDSVEAGVQRQQEQEARVRENDRATQKKIKEAESQPVAQDVVDFFDKPKKLATDEQIQIIVLHDSEGKFYPYLTKKFNVKNLHELTYEQADWFINEIKKKEAKNE